MEALALDRTAARLDMYEAEASFAPQVPEYGDISKDPSVVLAETNVLDPVALEVTDQTGIEAQEETGRLNDYANKLRGLARKPVAAVTAFGIGVGGTGIAAAGALAKESDSPRASIATNSWTRLGGDPLQRNVDTRNELVRLITSKKGATAMKYAGLTTKQRATARMQVRTGNFKKCHLKYGEKFKRMSFGINGTSVDKNVTFLDPRFKNKAADAWCIDLLMGKAKSPTKKIELKVPFICGNIAVKRVIDLMNKPRKPAQKPSKKPQPSKEVNICVDNDNNPTTSNGPGSVAQGGVCNENTVTQVTVVTVENPPPTPTPTPENIPPTIELTNPPAHVFESGQIEACAKTFDADGDTLRD